ncbi:MAG: YHYH domain-containing protein [Candidatus Sungbacteria bacterium]|uniref:YHYH domain-containing protein n=1 Tax=Candidatus Sungiibacteriota bacterium TaxID=2750080 RepID=A0A931SDD4_9BACT|nr:YHYH domain-containing protein [Candidatus Sungbacteria bacterium]
MVEKPKEIPISVAILVLAALAVPIFVFAHPGGTDSSGCHTCRTNCSSWGLSYGEYHCHASKGLPQPEDPIRSHRDDDGTGWTEPWLNYSYPSYSAPSYSTPDKPVLPPAIPKIEPTPTKPVVQPSTKKISEPKKAVKQEASKQEENQKIATTSTQTASVGSLVKNPEKSSKKKIWDKIKFWWSKVR